MNVNFTPTSDNCSTDGNGKLFDEGDLSDLHGDPIKKSIFKIKFYGDAQGTDNHETHKINYNS